MPSPSINDTAHGQVEKVSQMARGAIAKGHEVSLKVKLKVKPNVREYKRRKEK